MLKSMWAVWCNFQGDAGLEKACIRKVTGDSQRQALDFARMNGWFINGHNHLCPFHKPKGK